MGVAPADGNVLVISVVSTACSLDNSESAMIIHLCISVHQQIGKDGDARSTYTRDACETQVQYTSTQV